MFNCTLPLTPPQIPQRDLPLPATNAQDSSHHHPHLASGCRSRHLRLVPLKGRELETEQHFQFYKRNDPLRLPRSVGQRDRRSPFHLRPLPGRLCPSTGHTAIRLRQHKLQTVAPLGPRKSTRNTRQCTE